MSTELNIESRVEPCRLECRGHLTMAHKITESIYCSSCGAYLGEAVAGYLKTAQCFCGEITVLPDYRCAVEPEVLAV